MNGIDRLLCLGQRVADRGERMRQLAPRFEAIEQRHLTGTAPRAVTGFNLFQTPLPVARQMVELVRPWLVDGARVLEPSAGLGRLINAADELDGIRLKWLAVEESIECAKALLHAVKRAEVQNRDFLGVRPDESELFDVVIMNPPFKQGRDVKHIRHALEFVRPGGALVSLCYAGVKQESLRQDCDVWERLPAASFRSEGTDAEINMIRITKGART